jgi:hypothetical protein
MNREAIGLREVGGNEFNPAFHKFRDQGDVAGQAVELGYNQDRAEYATKPQRLIELGTGGLRSAFDLGELSEQFAGN